MQRRCILVLVVISVVACRQRSEYERIAREMNPILDLLEPKITSVLSPAVEDDDLEAMKARIKVCLGAEEQLWLLRSIRAEVEEIAVYFVRPMTLNVAAMLDARRLYCPGHDTPYWIEKCSSWCVSEFRMLSAAVDDLSEAARKEGVKIRTLRGADPKRQQLR